MADRDWWVQTPIDIRGTRWLVIACLVGATAVLLREPLLLMMAVVLALIATEASLWWRYGLSGVTYHRRFSAPLASFGEDVWLELVTENAKVLPLVWLHVEDEFPLALEFDKIALTPSSKPGVGVLATFSSLRPYERVRRRYHVQCHQRGAHRFGPSTIITGDPFGFSAREVTVPEVDVLIVYPRVVPLTVLGLPSHQSLGDLIPLRRVNEDPTLVAGVRPYVPGDNPRRIHWRASARLGTMQTRMLDPSAMIVTALFMDANTFEFFWEGQNSQLQELVITITASLAAHLLEKRHATGLYVNAPTSRGRQHVRLAPGRQPAQLQRILLDLALLIPGTGTRIEDTLAAESYAVRTGATIVIITSNVTDSLQRYLRRVTRSDRRYVLIACGEEPKLGQFLRSRLIVHHIGAEAAWNAIDQVTLAN